MVEKEWVLGLVETVRIRWGRSVSALRVFGVVRVRVFVFFLYFGFLGCLV